MEHDDYSIDIKHIIMSLFQEAAHEYLKSLDSWTTFGVFPFSLFKATPNNELVGDTFWKHGWQV
jgi:hypothetical protein